MMQIGKILTNKPLYCCSISSSTVVRESRRTKELQIAKKLKNALEPTFLSVQNTTLGLNSCGQMYKIIVESPVFDNKSKVEQWRLVASAIGDQMNSIHGFNLKTRSPEIIKSQVLEELEEFDDLSKDI